jgi:membrane-bound lytic murein transglycosylase A
MPFKSLSLPLFAVVATFGLAACTAIAPEKRPPITQTPSKPMPPSPPLAKPVEMFQATNFAALPGWVEDDVRESWPALMASCDALIRKVEWKDVCGRANKIDATDLSAVRTFFETDFVPYRVVNSEGVDTGLVTGYYEPLLRGARQRGGAYQTPLYRSPDDSFDAGSRQCVSRLKKYAFAWTFSG